MYISNSHFCYSSYKCRFNINECPWGLPNLSQIVLDAFISLLYNNVVEWLIRNHILLHLTFSKARSYCEWAAQLTKQHRNLISNQEIIFKAHLVQIQKHCRFIQRSKQVNPHSRSLLCIWSLNTVWMQINFIHTCKNVYIITGYQIQCIAFKN